MQDTKESGTPQTATHRSQEEPDKSKTPSKGKDQPPHASLAERDYYMAGIDGPAHTALGCPICGSQSFHSYNGRINSHCATCGSLERSRLLWLVLQATGNLTPGKRILHIAPEPFLLKGFHRLNGDTYYPCDLCPETYQNSICEIYPIDLCKGLGGLPETKFDLIIHNHVLEHLPCDYMQVLERFNERLVSGGQHMFSVPFRGAMTTEDLAHDLSDDQRTHQFGQSDHVRLFGTESFPDELDDAFDGRFQRVDVLDLIGEEVCANAYIPTHSLTRTDANSIFLFTKND